MKGLSVLLITFVLASKAHAQVAPQTGTPLGSGQAYTDSVEPAAATPAQAFAALDNLAPVTALANWIPGHFMVIPGYSPSYEAMNTEDYGCRDLNGEGRESW